MMADNGVWWSLQPFLADEDSNQYADPAAIAARRWWRRARCVHLTSRGRTA